jgi:hypothetical protein
MSVSNTVEPGYKTHRFIRHLAYNVRYSVVPINSSLLTITLHYSVITTLVYNDTKYSVPFHDVITEFDSIYLIEFHFDKLFVSSSSVILIDWRSN